ncbi:MAG: methylenetetrahydrofolate--tRNA-(uracil(54)-C(5))-methyltransferase (FADH(2)-oxidizing) TrmFO [Deltaproteobacteria bacterium]|nr:methylenetetrahydrofolate--tRNA-(uracil(54)-C(5))-methyltransferase (FADH(2)-oxidizing) TrmFO [Deltaproteobacteria bacterium]
MIFPVCVIGAGLAGSEAAYQLAKRGIAVALVEMRPKKMTPAHQTGLAAELVCSNSLRSDDPHNAVGLLKREMELLGSLVIRAAREARVPAGSALAVDRDRFSGAITRGLKELPLISWFENETVDLQSDENGVVVQMDSGQKIRARRALIASGPLTSDSLGQWIKKTTGEAFLYFYDSIAPIVEAESIDLGIAFKASRYQSATRTEGDYINCPMTRAEYENFVEAIARAELAEVHDFDRAKFFEGCLPIEEMVRRGPQTLAFGPMKPVGLVNPHRSTGKPHAVVQLRQDNLHASLYNMVGFQTRMKWPEQGRIFRMIPGLAEAEFVRFGSMHRNTYLCSPVLLNGSFELKQFPGVHLAGQITGCEGYVESAAVGLFCGCLLASLSREEEAQSPPPPTTALGALVHHILKADPDNFQPMNVNFGLFAPLEGKIKKKEKKELFVSRALTDMQAWADHFKKVFACNRETSLLPLF